MRNSPKQARAVKTREKLMSALETLLKSREFDQITVSEIAKNAGVSTGLLYAHFKNKEDFLEALLESYRARVISRLEELEQRDQKADFQAVGSLKEALRLIADYAYQQLEEDAHILRAVSHHLRTRSDNEWQQWQELRIRAFATIAIVVEAYEEDIARPINATTKTMLVYFFNSIFLQRLFLRRGDHLGGVTIDREAFISEITDFAFGYLTNPPQGNADQDSIL